MADEPREFLRAPIPEIAEVARAHDDAVTAHLAGDREAAARLRFPRAHNDTAPRAGDAGDGRSTPIHFLPDINAIIDFSPGSARKNGLSL